MVKVKQIVYYKDAQVHISNVLLTPLCLKERLFNSGSQSNFFSWYNLFNVGFNNNLYTAPTNKMIYIGTITKQYNFQPNYTISSDEGKILTIHNYSLMNLLVRDYQQNKFNIYTPDTHKKINDKYFLTNAPYQAVFFNDVNGDGTSKTEYVRSEYTLDSIYNFSIEQDVYFDREDEVLLSKVKSVAILKKIYTSTGLYLGLSEQCRIFYEAVPHPPIQFLPPPIKAQPKKKRKR